MTSYFTYEKDFANRWNPVVFHHEKPFSKGVNGTAPDRTTLHVIPSELLGDDGVSPMFAKLMKMFPAPKEG